MSPETQVVSNVPDITTTAVKIVTPEEAIVYDRIAEEFSPRMITLRRIDEADETLGVTPLVAERAKQYGQVMLAVTGHASEAGQVFDDPRWSSVLALRRFGVEINQARREQAGRNIFKRLYIIMQQVW